MKGWMGGKRRRMAVEKRDPVARQRQFFARRREQRNRPNPLPPRDRLNARKYLDAFRHGNRPTPESSTRNQAANRVANQFKGDLLFLAPQALETVASDLAALQRQRHDENNGTQGPDKRDLEEQDDQAELQQLDKLNKNKQLMSNEIRIFNEREERTPRYRAPVLPQNFLNSQNSHPIQDPIPSKRRWILTDRNATSSQDEPRKRHRADIDGPPIHGLTTQPQVSDWLPPPSIPEIQSGYLQSVQQDEAPRNQTRAYRLPSRSPSPRPLKARMLQMGALAQSLQVSTSQSQEHYHPLQQVHRNVTRTYKFDRPSNSRASRESHRLETPAVSTDQNESNCEIKIPREEFPTTRDVEGIFDNSRPALLAMKGQDKKDTPSFDDAKLADMGSILCKFPPIQIDSESNDSSSSETVSEPVPFTCQSILSRGPFELDQINAEVLRIEQEMLNDPDYTVGLFAHPPQLRKFKSRVLRVSPISNLESIGTTRSTSEQTSPVLGKENVVPEGVGSQSVDRDAANASNAPSTPSAMLGMEIVISPSAQNPLENTSTRENTNS